MTEPAIAGHWYLGAMNDATFIIDGPPSPAPDDTGPYLAANGPKPISAPIDDRNGKLIVEAHNAVVAEKDAELCRLKSQLSACEQANAVLAKTDGLAQLVISEAATKSATIARLYGELAAARAALEWIAEPSLGRAHVVFRVEAQDRARAVLAKLSKGA